MMTHLIAIIFTGAIGIIILKNGSVVGYLCVWASLLLCVFFICEHEKPKHEFKEGQHLLIKSGRRIVNIKINGVTEKCVFISGAYPHSGWRKKSRVRVLEVIS